jgi:hypothetical protein
VQHGGRNACACVGVTKPPANASPTPTLNTPTTVNTPVVTGRFFMKAVCFVMFIPVFVS